MGICAHLAIAISPRAKSDQLAEAKLRAMDVANALQLCHNLFPFLALKDEDKSQRIFRKGFTSSFARAEKNIIRIIED